MTLFAYPQVDITMTEVECIALIYILYNNRKCEISSIRKIYV